MAYLQRAVATLRISGDDLKPDEVSALLGAAPTFARTKGQEVPSKVPSGVHAARRGQWHLAATDSAPEDLDGQVAELLAKLTGDLAVWSDLSRRFDVNLFCGWFMGSSNEGVLVSSKTLLSLGERGIDLGMDIYGPDTDA